MGCTFGALRVSGAGSDGVAGFGFGGDGFGLDGVGWAFGEDLFHVGVVAVDVVEEVGLAVVVDDGGEVEDEDGERGFEDEGFVVGAVVQGVVDLVEVPV